MANPCGWLPDLSGAYTYAAAPPVLGAIPESGGVRRDAFDPRQFGNSCTGHSIVQLAHALTGTRYSPYFSYWGGAIHDQGATPADIGVTTAGVVASAELHGLLEYDRWNADDVRALRSSPLKRPRALDRVCAQRTKLDMNAILPGADAFDRVRATLARGYAVAIVVNVDDAFDRLGPDGVVGPERGRVRGRHMITAWDYDGDQVHCLDHWARGPIYLRANRINVSPMIVYATGVS